MATHSRRRIGQAGITLIELLIAGFIGGFIAVTMSTMLNSYTRASKLAETRIKAVGETLLGNRALFQDIRQGGISFNMLNLQMDDKGNAFYDFLPDSACVSACSRTITLDRTTTTRSLVIASAMKNLNPPASLAPAMAPIVAGGAAKGFYDQPNPGVVNKAGTITLNKANLKAAINAVDTVGAISTGLKLFAAKRILRFYSPFPQRVVASAAGQIPLPDMTQPSRPLSFVGVVNDAATEIIAPAPSVLTELAIGTQRRPDMAASTDPAGVMADAPNDTDGFSGIDEFFRYLPPIGGTGAFAMVAPVQFIRYRINPIVVQGFATGELIREVHNGTSFTNSRVVASPVKSVAFYRENISVPSIQPTLKIDKVPYKNIMKTQ